ncbi:MAG: hypothetical protein HZC43_03125 [Nitrosomonadales bacterium]|nr:hypothetical protein [Nitrosomonadales bacterium]
MNMKKQLATESTEFPEKNKRAIRPRCFTQQMKKMKTRITAALSVISVA